MWCNFCCASFHVLDYLSKDYECNSYLNAIYFDLSWDLFSFSRVKRECVWFSSVFTDFVSYQSWNPKGSGETFWIYLRVNFFLLLSLVLILFVCTICLHLCRFLLISNETTLTPKTYTNIRILWRRSYSSLFKVKLEN